MFSVELRYRTRSDESRIARHKRFVERASSATNSWWRSASPLGLEDDVNALEVAVDLTPCLRPDLNGYVAYVLRREHYLQDKALFDDRLVITCEATDENFSDLTEGVFQDLISAFQPYRASVITDEDIALDDWDLAVAKSATSGRDEDGRDSVLRIWPLSFFDEELLGRSFGVDGKTALNHLEEADISVLHLKDGILVQLSNEPLTGKELSEVSERAIYSLLGED